MSGAAPASKRPTRDDLAVLLLAHGVTGTARELGVHPSTVRQWRDAERLVVVRRTVADRRELIVTWYRQGLGAPEIARRLGVDRGAVRRQLAAAGVPRRRVGRQVTRTPPPPAELAQAWAELGSAVKVAARYQVGTTTVRRWRDTAGIAAGEVAGRRGKHPDNVPTAEVLHQFHVRKQMSVEEIARYHAVSWRTVDRWLRRAEIPRMPGSHSRGAVMAAERTSSQRR